MQSLILSCLQCLSSLLLSYVSTETRAVDTFKWRTGGHVLHKRILRNSEIKYERLDSTSFNYPTLAPNVRLASWRRRSVGLSAPKTQQRPAAELIFAEGHAMNSFAYSRRQIFVSLLNTPVVSFSGAYR